MGAPQAWRKSYTGRGLAVAVIDVGRSIEDVRPAGAAPPLPPMPDELILEPSPAAPKEEKKDQWQSITG